MKTLIRIFVLAGLTFLASSCDTLDTLVQADSASFAFKFSGLKVVEESDEITKAGALDLIAQVRPLLDNSVNTVEGVLQIIKSQIDWDKYKPSDRLLIDLVFNEAEIRLGQMASQTDADGNPIILPEEVRVSALQILDWIEDGIMLASDDD